MGINGYAIIPFKEIKRGIGKMERNTKGILFTVAGGVFWGLSGIFGKYLFDVKELTAVWLVTLRLVTAGAIMLLMAVRVRRKKVFDVWKCKKTALDQIVFSLFGMSACQMSFFLAIQYSNPGTATVLQYIAPALIMLFCLTIEKRKPKMVEVLVLLMVIMGVFLLSTHGDIHNLAITKRALFWGLVAAVSLAIYNVQPERLLSEFGALETVGWGMLVGGVLLTPVIRLWNAPGIWDIQTVGMVLIVIVFGTIIPFGCYLQGVLLLGPVKASMFACVEPLVATIMSVLLLGELFGGVDVLGMALIIGGVTALAVFDKKVYTE